MKSNEDVTADSTIESRLVTEEGVPRVTPSSQASTSTSSKVTQGRARQIISCCHPKVRSVARFYSMFGREHTGRYVVSLLRLHLLHAARRKRPPPRHPRRIRCSPWQDESLPVEDVDR